MRPTTELLDFLNKAQQITSGFFPPDSKTARLDYTLRPHISNDTQNLNFRIDGQTLIWNSGDVIQRDVYWPGPAGSKSSLSSGDKANQIPFAVADGPWAAFRLFQLGERSLRNLTWKMTSNGEPMMVPVQVEFVYEFPGGIDVFDRNFFRTLRCPNVAAQR
jgi:type VI protein secretion system component VasK